MTAALAVLLGTPLLALALLGILCRRVRTPEVHRRCHDRSCGICCHWARRWGRE